MVPSPVGEGERHARRIRSCSRLHTLEHTARHTRPGSRYPNPSPLTAITAPAHMACGRATAHRVFQYTAHLSSVQVFLQTRCLAGAGLGPVWWVNQAWVG